MTEDFLQYVWRNSLYSSPTFTTNKGREIKIIKPGIMNKDAGPDFFCAHIQIDDVILVGNVEIHINSSDWYRHNHNKDKAYNNVILSVNYFNDVEVQNSLGDTIETIELKFAEDLYKLYDYIRNNNEMPKCLKYINKIPIYKLKIHLESLLIERLEAKNEDIRKDVENTNNDWEECFYRLVLKYWGGNVNSDAFYRLSLVIPYKILLKHSNNIQSIEALLFGASGLLDNTYDDTYSNTLRGEWAYLKRKYKLSEMSISEWRFMRTRPNLFPTIRISLLSSFITQLSHICRDIITKDVSVKDISSFMNKISTSSYWNEHYTFGKLSSYKLKNMGLLMQQIIIINCIIPFIFGYGKYNEDENIIERAINLMYELPLEINRITKSWKESLGVELNNAANSQAIIHLNKEYCSQKKCIKCKLGVDIFKTNIIKLSD